MLTQKRTVKFGLLLILTGLIIPVLHAAAPINLKQIIRQFALNQKLRGQEKIYLHTDKEFYLTGENIWYKAYLLDATRHLPSDKSKFIYTELIDKADSIVLRQKLHQDSIGFYGNMLLPKDLPSGKYQLRAYTIWMENTPEEFFFRKVITIHNPYPNKADSIEASSPDKTLPTKVSTKNATGSDALKPDIQFFPEGGHLITGRTNLVAFKAIDTTGLSVEVSGTIMDDSGTKVCNFNSVLKGMGRFLLPVESGQSYFAEIKITNGKTFRFALPTPTDNALDVRAKILPNCLVYYLDKGDAIPADLKRFLIIHQRGKLLRIEEVNRIPKVDTLKFNGLSDGIAHILLTDSLGNPLTERLCFIQNPANRKKVVLATQHNSEKDLLQLSVTDEHGKAVDGSYSISVSGNDLPLGNRTHIESNLLLSAELKGYIEEPEIYFLDSLDNRSVKIDNLLLTQGWSRFDVPVLLQGTVTAGKHPVEKGQILSGIVRDKKKSLPAADIPVTIMGMKSRVLEAPVTDTNGRFFVESISFSDSTNFIFRAGDKMKSKHYIEVDQDTFPKIRTDMPKVRLDNIGETRLSQQIKLLKVTDKMRQVNLGQVDVNANRFQKPKSKSYFNQMSEQTVDQTRLKDYPKYSLPEVLPLLFPFIQNDAMSNAPTMRNVTKNEFITPALLVNERYFEWDEFAIYGYLTEDIESIDIVRGITAQQFAQNPGIVVVHLKAGAQNKLQSNVQIVNLLGWHKPAGFYRPKYIYSDEKKLLSPYATLYWSPDVRVNSTGNVVVPIQIHTTQPLRVVLEGVNNRGEIIHYQSVTK